jgi:hypothetical protein
MKIPLTATLLILLSGNVFAAKAAIQKDYQGLWHDIKSSCKNDPIEHDSGYKITADTIIQYEQSCQIKKITRSDSHSITARYDCTEEGETYSQTMKLTLSKDKKHLSVDKRQLFRCE